MLYLLGDLLALLAWRALQAAAAGGWSLLYKHFAQPTALCRSCQLRRRRAAKRCTHWSSNHFVGCMRDMNRRKEMGILRLSLGNFASCSSKSELWCAMDFAGPRKSWRLTGSAGRAAASPLLSSTLSLLADSMTSTTPFHRSPDCTDHGVRRFRTTRNPRGCGPAICPWKSLRR